VGDAVARPARIRDHPGCSVRRDARRDCAAAVRLKLNPMHSDIAQLVSLALYSPKPDESVTFFHDLLGMEISHREGQSVYLHAYEDFYQYTLKITEASQPGMEAVTWRAASPEALAQCVAR